MGEEGICWICLTSARYVYMRSRFYHGSLNEPGKTETYEDIEDVAANSVTHCHVTEALLDDSQRREGIGYAYTRCHEGQTHHGIGNSQGTA